MSHDIFNLDDLNTEVEDIDEPNSGAGTGDESKYVHSNYIKREKPPSLTGVTSTILINFVNILTCLF